jgi:AcrR family transcriptional regulator
VKNRTTPLISARKRPRQARSTQLVADILTAAARVLATEGAARFTTARVAERAGVSIGSLYQYFPNREAILFALQSDEWRRTTKALQGILEDRSLAPLDRLRAAVRVFVRSECEEAAMRRALDHSAPFHHDTPEAEETLAAGRRLWRAFIDEAWPDLPDSPSANSPSAMTADLLLMTLTGVGKHISEHCRADAEIDAHTEALADMLCRCMAGVQPGSTD